MKKSFIATKRIDKNIKVGDFVKFIDGSGFSIKDATIDYPAIVYKYPLIFGLDTIVKNIAFKVIKTGVDDRIIASGYDHGYFQDIELEAPNGIIVYSCSAFVKKEKQEINYIPHSLINSIRANNNQMIQVICKNHESWFASNIVPDSNGITGKFTRLEY